MEICNRFVRNRSTYNRLIPAGGGSGGSFFTCGKIQGAFCRSARIRDFLVGNGSGLQPCSKSFEDLNSSATLLRDLRIEFGGEG